MIETRFTDQTGIMIGCIDAYNVTEHKNVRAWGHFDFNDGRQTHVGPWYKTKIEALQDHEDYLIRAGWMKGAAK